MKILVGCSSPPDAGAGILSCAREISEALISKGYEIHFAAPTPRDWSWINHNQVRHVPTNQSDNPQEACQRLLRYIKKTEIVGVINNDNPFVQSIFPGLGCPALAIGHLGQGSIASLACYRHEWSDYVVAISNDMQRTFVLKYGVPIVKCPVIHNGVRDLGQDIDLEHRQSNILRVIFAGGFNKLKGGNHVLKAVLGDKERWKGIELSWYGSMPSSVVRKTHGLPHVKLHGRVPRHEVLQSLRNSDVLLFPSRIEGCPMAMLEAMSLGVVPIASDGIGAMRWLIASGVEGYVCHLRGWPEQMMECLLHMQKHPDILAEMKKAVRARFLREYQSGHVVDKLLERLKSPTVDRRKRPMKFEVLRWHRPFRPDGLKAPLWDRVLIRLGLLRVAGEITSDG